MKVVASPNPTMPTTAPESNPITPEDRKAVEDLILSLVEDARREERERRLLAATNTWINAFTSFKRLRKRAGLPSSRQEWLAYGSLLGAIKAGGKAILIQIERGGFDPSPIISAEAFAACVAETVEDDALLDGGYLEREIDHEIEAVFTVA